MLIKCFALGMLQANCFIVTDENTLECAVIDPGAESNKIMHYLESNKLKCRYILLTHGHLDHTGAAEEVMEQAGATICMNKKDVRNSLMEAFYKFNAPDGTMFVSEGDKINVGSLVFEVIETPGHSEGGVTFRCGEALFTGDTLFKDSCGRTDFPGCSGADMMKSLKKLYDLPGDYEVYTGHMEGTTLERERRFNYCMQQAIEE